MVESGAEIWPNGYVWAHMRCISVDGDCFHFVWCFVFSFVHSCVLPGVAIVFQMRRGLVALFLICSCFCVCLSLSVF